MVFYEKFINHYHKNSHLLYKNIFKIVIQLCIFTRMFTTLYQLNFEQLRTS